MYIFQTFCATGSMTGAPKKRSVQILQELECDERTIYSGVAGYWCVSGGGDWSVIIRSIYNCDNPLTNNTSLPTESNRDRPRGASHNGFDHFTASQARGGAHTRDEPASKGPGTAWSIGAGGAITALSDAEGEWDEMLVKLHSVLRAFGANPTTR